MDKAVEAARKELRNQGCNTSTMCSSSPCECVQRAITAADAARAVTDDEVDKIFYGWEQHSRDLPRDYLRRRGFKVIRG